MQWDEAKCTQECASKIFLIITSQFVPYPLLRSLFLYCIQVAKGKHYHSPLLVENASIWGVLKAFWFSLNDQSKWPIAKKVQCGCTHIWMYTQLIDMDYK